MFVHPNRVLGRPLKHDDAVIVIKQNDRGPVFSCDLYILSIRNKLLNTSSTMSAATEFRPYPKISNSIFETFSLKGKVAVVCGGAAGIGYEVSVLSHPDDIFLQLRLTYR